MNWLATVATQLTAQVRLVAGTGKCTIGQVIERTRPELVGRPQGPFQPRFTTTFDYGEIDGDNTVVRQSAAVQAPVVGLFANASFPIIYRPFTHGELASSRALRDALALLRDEIPVLGVPQKPTCFLFSVHSPVEFVLTDGQGRRLGASGPSETFREIPGATYDRFFDMKVAAVDNADAFRATLRGTAEGDATIRLRWVIGGTLSREAIFLHVPVTPTTRLTISFDVATRQVGGLAVDADNDGVTDFELQPLLLDSVAAQDTSGPNLSITLPAVGQAVVGKFPVQWTANDPESGVNLSLAFIDRDTAAQRTLPSPQAIEVSPGTHTLELFAENREGLLSTTRRDFTAFRYTWLQPTIGASGLVENAGRTLPVRFTVVRGDGTFVTDSSVAVELVDGQGNVVVGPFTLGTTPDAGIVVQNDAYHVNLRTKGAAPGRYRIRARFDSAQLLGMLELPLTLR